MAMAPLGRGCVPRLAMGSQGEPKMGMVFGFFVHLRFSCKDSAVKNQNFLLFSSLLSSDCALSECFDDSRISGLGSCGTKWRDKKVARLPRSART